MASERTGFSPFLKGTKRSKDPSSFVLNALRSGPRSLSDLISHTDIGITELLGLVGDLEKTGLIKSDPNLNTYTLTPEGEKMAEVVGRL